MILVTGASGVVGEAIYNCLLKFYKVIGTRYSNKDPRFIRLDFTDADKVAKFFRKNKISTIIHCASRAPSRSCAKNKSEIYEMNVKMLINILNNINKHARFINISATSLYKLRGNSRLDESSLPDCDNFHQLSKKHIEELLDLFYKGTSNLLQIRISSPYSTSRENNSILCRFIKQALSDNRISLWGTGKRRQALTNVETLAFIVKKLFEKKVNGTFNCVTTSSISMWQLARKIKKYNKKICIRRINMRDPEDNHRTHVDISKISRIVTIEDRLENDIARIMLRLSE